MFTTPRVTKSVPRTVGTETDPAGDPGNGQQGRKGESRGLHGEESR